MTTTTHAPTEDSLAVREVVRRNRQTLSSPARDVMDSVSNLNADLTRGKQWRNGDYSVIVLPRLGDKRKGNYKLSSDDVVEMKILLLRGVPVKDIAAAFPVGEATVYNIKNGKTWSNITVIDKVAQKSL